MNRQPSPMVVTAGSPAPFRQIRTTCAALAVLTGVLAAQAGRDESSTSLRRSVGLSAGPDGSCRAIAFDYRATLTADGVEYTPMLGESAPRRLPLTLSLQAVDRGALTLHEARPSQPHAQGTRVTYSRGDLLEQWDVTAAGLKQSIVFPQPIAGTGDLVVRYRWQSDLSPRGVGPRSVEFLWPEVGGVRVDGVVGVDAAGKRVAGEVRRVHETLEFVLPDGFVRAAKYPLVLDPLIGSVIMVVSGGGAQVSDIAVLPNQNVHLVACQRRASLTDYNVVAQCMNSTSGALIGPLLDIDTGTTLARLPRVGAVSATNQFVVVWQSGQSAFGPWHVRCRGIDASTLALSNSVFVGVTASDEEQVAVGSDLSGTDDEAIVVWSTGSTVTAAQITLSAGLAPVVLATAVIANSDTYRHVAISKACGVGARFLVAWQQSTPHGIGCQYITRNLGLLGSLAFAGGTDDARPCVDGNNDAYLVAWLRREAAGPAHDIVCAGVGSNLTGTLSLTQPARLVIDTPGVDEIEPDLALMGSKYGLVYTERRGVLEDDARAVLINPDCSTCNTNHVLAGIGRGVRQGQARIAGRSLGTLGSETAVIGYTNSNDTPPFESDVHVQLFRTLGPGVPAVDRLGGCGPGGSHDSNTGAFVVGNPDFRFRLTGASPTAIVALLIGLPSSGLACGNCTFTNPLLVISAVNNAGNAAVPLPMPCNPDIANVQLETQWLSLGVNATPCPLLVGAAATNRRLLTVGQ